jgi:EmrB/QacA subfamily drug resistance transporter
VRDGSSDETSPEQTHARGSMNAIASSSEPRSVTTPTSDSERTAVLVVACAAAFLTPFMGSALNLAIPTIGAEMHASAVTLNWVVTAFLVASAAFLLPFGRTGDLFGRKRVFIAGMLVSAAAATACGLAHSIAWLVALRVLHGVGAAMGFATSVAILTSVFPAARRGRVFGISTASTYTGLSLGPVIGGTLTQQLGWRSIFFIAGAVALALALVALLAVRGEWRGGRGTRFDGLGATLYAASVALLMAGISTLRTFPAARFCALAGAVGVVAFVLRELHSSSPILDVRLFSNVTFAFSNLAALINYSATFAVSFLLSLYLQSVRGLPPQAAGLILLAQPLVMALLSPLAGRLSDHIEPRLVASLGMAVTSVGLALFALLSPGTALSAVVAELMVVGLGFALFSSPNTNAVMSSVEYHHYGIGSATLGTMRLVGQALSMSLAGLIFASYMGRAGISRETAPLLLASIHTAFAISAVLCALGVLASAARGRVNRGAPPASGC